MLEINSFNRVKGTSEEVGLGGFKKPTSVTGPVTRNVEHKPSSAQSSAALTFDLLKSLSRLILSTH